MSNENWNNSEQNRNVDPWERDTYQTGSTTPPKNHGGTIAVFLAFAICACGLLSILAMLKIPLFTGQEEPTAPNSPLTIQSNSGNLGPTAVDPTQSGRMEQDPTENDTYNVTVQPSPVGQENIPQLGGLSLQEIYETCAPSVVSISCNYYGGSSTGTGVILNADGYIVTNAHVVQDAITVQVILTTWALDDPGCGHCRIG